MDEVFRSYLDPAFRYVWARGPRQVRDRADARSGGLNCIALAHLVIRDLFGHTLPPSFQSLEMFRDRQHFEPVAGGSEPCVGDLLWFGAADPAVSPDDFVPRFQAGELVNVRDFAVNHVAIRTDTTPGTDAPLLHASPLDGTNALWPLRRFGQYPRYARVYGVHRLRADRRGA
jgi:hypothetical protein